jgi:PAS domain S-box-containing protein
MIPDFAQSQALRDCCRDEATFEQLKQILASTWENPSVEAMVDQKQNQCRPTSQFTEPTRSWPDLLQGVAEATNQLLTNGDFTVAVNQSLATLGRVTGVDRVYIFEVHPHPETGESAASQRFEWVRESVTPQIDNPDFQNQIFAAAGLSQWYDTLLVGNSISGLTREFGTAERQLLQSQEILSILIVPILVRGKLWGLIGFDNCHSERRWSKDEEAVLLTMAANLGGLIARQQTEIALRQSELRLQRIAANVPGMIFQFLRRPDGSELVLFASSGCRELFEVEPAETQADFSQLKALIHPDDHQTYEQSVLASAATLQPWTWEGRIIAPSGKLKWLQCASRPERQPNGDILWDGLLMDITERKHLEEASERERRLFLAGPVTVFRWWWLARENWPVEYVSPNVTQFGYQPDDFTSGRVNYASIVYPDDLGRMAAEIETYRVAGVPSYELDYRIIRPDGQVRWVYDFSVVVRNAQGDITCSEGYILDITDRKQVEQALREAEAATRASELRFRSIVSSTPGVIYRCACDADWTMEFISNEIETILGYPATDFIADQVRTFTSIIHPEDTAIVEQVVQQGIKARQPYVIEYRVVRADGAIRWVYEKGQGVYDEDDLLWLDGVIFDISDRKQAEAALRESEEKFSKAFRSSPSAIAITNPEGHLIEVNESFLCISGYQREEVIGRTTIELNIWVNLEDRASTIQMLQEVGVIRNLECQFRKKSGEVFAGLFSAEIINLAGKPWILSVVHDITDRKQAEEQLRLSAERDRLLAQIALRIRQSLDLEQILSTTVTEVRAFLQADRVFIGYLDANNLQGKIMAESVTPNWQSLLGVVFTQTHLKEVRTVFTPGGIRVIDDTTQVEISSVWAEYFHQYQVRASMAVPILLGGSFLGVLVAHQCSGPRHWQPFEIDLLEQLATQVAIALQQGKLYQQVLSLNVNLEGQVEERTAQLQQRNRELQELNHLKDIFLHAVSHDLRTPVMGTLLVLKNLLNQPEDVIPLSRSILERMIQSNERQLNLINSLLEVHASEVQGIVLHQECLQLGTLVQAIIVDMEPLLAKNQATLTNLVPDDLPWVNADPTQLRRVFENLLTNALKHNPPGLSLTLNATVTGGIIRYTLQDNGVGMSQAECDHLFEPYFRGASARHLTGIGLGLYLCRQIITAHGGQIGVISSPGEGATFWFALPLVTPSCFPQE